MSNGIYESIELGIEGNLATIMLRRPDVLNAMSIELLEEMMSALQLVEQSDSIRALMITGEGRGFCAGADLSRADLSFDTEKRQAQGSATRAEMEKFFNPLASAIYNMQKPVVAAVNGVAAGAGMSIALACDIVYAAQSAYFVQVFTPQLGIIPDLGSTWLLPRLVGNARARAAMLLGEKISAEQAADWGMIYRAVDDDKMLEEAQATATRLASGATFGIGKLKEAIKASEHNSFDQQLMTEAELQEACCSSSDFIEGLRAFFDRRKPEFSGQESASADAYPADKSD